MFRIKICGLTRPRDAQHAAACGADAVGLNFCPSSKRHVEVDVAQEIAATLPSDVARVGVFVNSLAEQIREVAGAVPLDMIQLHGDEPNELIADLQPLPVVRAVRWGEETVDDLVDAWSACGAAALLVDGHSAAAYGGTGVKLDWRQVGDLVSRIAMPLVLAGGLNADNVAKAARISRPAAVDVASGVESSPGVKDPALVARFVEQARLGLS